MDTSSLLSVPVIPGAPDASSFSASGVSADGSHPILRLQPPTPTVPIHPGTVQPVPIRSLGDASAILEAHDDLSSSGSGSPGHSSPVDVPVHAGAQMTFFDPAQMHSPTCEPDAMDQDCPDVLVPGLEAFSGGKAAPKRMDSRHHPYRGNRSRTATESSAASATSASSAASSRVTRASLRGQGHHRAISTSSEASSAGIDITGLGLGSSSHSGSYYSGSPPDAGYVDPAMLVDGPFGAQTLGIPAGPYYSSGSGDSSYGNESDSGMGSRFTPSPAAGHAALQHPPFAFHPGAMYDPNAGLMPGFADGGAPGDDRKSSIATVRPPPKKKGQAQKEKAPVQKVSHARKAPPGHIKRPKNAFIIFRSWFCQSDHVAKVGITDHRHISRIAGQVWKNMEPEEKKQYEDEADEEKRKHREENPEYRYKPTFNKDNRPRRRRRDRQLGEEEEEERRCQKVADLLCNAKARGEDIDAALKAEAQALLAQGAGTHLNNRFEGELRKRSIKIGELLTVHPGERIPSRGPSAVPEVLPVHQQQAPAPSRSPPKPKSKKGKKAATKSDHSSPDSAHLQDIPLQYDPTIGAVQPPPWHAAASLSIQHIPVSAFHDVPSQHFSFHEPATGPADLGQQLRDYTMLGATTDPSSSLASYSFPGPAPSAGGYGMDGGDLMIVQPDGAGGRKMSIGRWTRDTGGMGAEGGMGNIDVFRLDDNLLRNVFPSAEMGAEPILADRYINADMVAPTPPSYPAQAIQVHSGATDGPTYRIQDLSDLASIPRPDNEANQYIYLDKAQAANDDLMQSILDRGFGVTFDAPDPGVPGATGAPFVPTFA